MVIDQHFCGRMMAIIGLSLLATACTTPRVSSTGPQTLRYALLTGSGARGGEQIVERNGEGSTRVRYIFKDNGRGPELTEQIRQAPDGTVLSYASKGQATLGGPVDESFSREAGVVRWQSTSERGEARDVPATAHYIELNGSMELSSILLGSFTHQREHTLAAVPAGTLKLNVIDEMDLKATNGQTRSVQLVSITGIGLTPNFIWRTAPQHGRPRAFAMIYPGWFAGIEEGWEEQVRALSARQQSAENRLLRQMSQQLRKPLSGLTVDRNARVFDSTTATLADQASDIYLLRGRITAVVPAGTAGGMAPENVIDAKGRVALPGLFDMHGHMGAWDGALHLAAGVTTVRDMGSANHVLQTHMDDAHAGTLLSPQVIPCGFLEGRSPHSANLGIIIETLQQAKDAVDWYATRDYRQLKIYNSFPREMVPDITRYAHAKGMRVSGHVPAFMRAQEVVEQGFDEIQHINQVMLNFLVTPTTDTRTLERFYLPAEKLAALDLKSPQVRQFVELLKARKTVIDPTVVTFDFIRQRAGDMSEPYAPIAEHLPVSLQRGLRDGSMNIPDDATAVRYRASYDKMVAFIGDLYREGVPIVAGTDAFAGFTLHAELALYVRAGLTPAQALQVATLHGARYSGVEADRGRIAVGMRADIVLVDGNPVERIDDLRKIALVITQSSVIDPSEAHRSLGIRPFISAAPTVDRSAAAQSGHADSHEGHGAWVGANPSGAMHMHRH